MNRILIVLIFLPVFLFSQENKTKKSNKSKVDGWSGFKYMSNEEKIKGNISGKVKSLEERKARKPKTLRQVTYNYGY